MMKIMIIAVGVAATLWLGVIGNALRGIHHDLTMANCLALAKDGIKCAAARP